MMDTNRAKQFIQKAEKLSIWIDQSISDFESAGQIYDIDNVERHFFTLLGLFESFYQAIVDAAKKLEYEGIRDQINNDRENDQLLKYLRFARNSEIHDAVLKWKPSMRHLEVEIIDQEKFDTIINDKPSNLHLFYFLYDVNSQKDLIETMKLIPIPSKSKCNDAGVRVKVNLDCLSLSSFRTGRGKNKKTIQAPKSHNGKFIPPSAWICVKEARQYYKSKLSEITALNKELNIATTVDRKKRCG